MAGSWSEGSACRDEVGVQARGRALGIGGSAGTGQRLQNPAPGGARSGTEGGGHQVQEGERGWQINIFRPVLAVGWGLLKNLIRCVCQADVTAS